MRDTSRRGVYMLRASIMNNNGTAIKDSMRFWSVLSFENFRVSLSSHSKFARKSRPPTLCVQCVLCRAGEVLCGSGAVLTLVGC